MQKQFFPKNMIATTKCVSSEQTNVGHLPLVNCPLKCSLDQTHTDYKHLLLRLIGARSDVALRRRNCDVTKCINFEIWGNQYQ